MATGASNAGIAESMVITRRAAEKYMSVCDLLGTAAGKSGKGEAVLQPGQLYVRIWSASIGQPACIAVHLFWKRFNTMGATFSIYGGLIMAVPLMTFLPVVSGTPTSLARSANFDWFLLRNPALISIPSGFLCGFVGTLDQQGAAPGGALR